MPATRRSRLIARVLAVALLIGQMGAAAHAFSHQVDDPQGIPDTTQGCRTCHSFAPLLFAVGGSPSAALVIPHATYAFAPVARTPAALNPHHPAFRSRAPPAFL
ncbi:MAG: hypothetical protein EPO25_03185 [Gammaproteobacteria bacterium]|nr:MAG: hypothetical protein EPO25_03185 [Gammaproteobacteria bacterium]